jgi:protein-tyrosine phosphatase
MISFVQDCLAIGNEGDAANESFLIDSGITAVLNVAAEVMPLHYQSDIISAKVGLIDGPGNYPSLYTVAIQILDVFLTEGEMVLVHCAAGISRAPFIVTCYLVLKQDVSYSEAEQFILSRRPEVNIQHVHLETYSEEFTSRYSKSLVS